MAERDAGFGFSALAALLMIPLLAERREIRPEAFSYFFAALFDGLFLGFVISVILGNFVIQGKWVLENKEVLEPVTVGSEQKFLLKKGGDSYIYFTKDAEQQTSVIALKYIIMQI